MALPGVESAGMASVLPVSFNGNTDWIRFVGRPYNGEHNEVNQRDVSAAYLQTVGARLVRGRYFADADDTTRPRVVIINQALADRYYPGQDPIGQKFGDTSLTPASLKEIVGIVADIREGQLDSEIWPAVYYPFNQSPDSTYALVVRTTQPPSAIVGTLATTIAQLDPGIGTIRGATMNDRITDSPVGVCPPIVGVAAWRIRRARAASRHRRTLRSHRLYRESAAAGDWRPPRARRDEGFGVSAGLARGRTVDRNRHRYRSCVLDWRRDVDAQSALRYRAVGCAHKARQTKRRQRFASHTAICSRSCGEHYGTVSRRFQSACCVAHAADALPQCCLLLAVEIYRGKRNGATRQRGRLGSCIVHGQGNPLHPPVDSRRSR